MWAADNNLLVRYYTCDDENKSAVQSHESGPLAMQN